MSWRDEEQEASFRGVSFFCETDEQPAGQRTQINEYPLRDMPTVQFLGKAATKITMTGWVAGHDFMEKRDALLAALEEPSPGELIHPWHGRMMASAVSSSYSHNVKEKGMCRFELTFVREEDAETAPTVKQNLAAALEKELPSSYLSFIDEFVEKINSLNFLDVSIEGVAKPLREILGVVSSLYGSASSLISAGLGMYDMIVSKPREFATALSSLIQSATSGFNGFYSASGSATVGGINDRLRAIETLHNIPMPISTESNQLVAITKQLVERNILLDSAAGAAKFPSFDSATVQLRKVAPSVSLGSTAEVHSVGVDELPFEALGTDYVAVPVADDVWKVRKDLGEFIWSAMAQSSGESYEKLNSVRGVMLRHLAKVARGATPIIQVENPMAQPALVIAYRHFGDARRAAELINRNQVIHPGFVPAKALQVSRE